MAGKRSTKREFDWRTYTKPVRLLTREQEEALGSGVLHPLLELALAGRGVSLEIRARQASLYYRGFSLARVGGQDAAFSASVDANLRVPRAERPGVERLEAWPLESAVQVSAFVAELGQMCALLDGFAAGEPPSAREDLAAFARANRQTPEVAELIVVDIEYQYGRRRYDFVGMRRAQSVGGAEAFSAPRLVIGELHTGAKSLRRGSNLTSFGADAAEFAHALAGEHLARAKAELAESEWQRERLGLSPQTPFARFADGMPELLVAFADPSFTQPASDAPLSELHDRLVARRFPTELLRLAAIGASRPETDDLSLAVGAADLLDYRAFKGMRKRLRG
jgi:hypothetical protein